MKIDERRQLVREMWSDHSVGEISRILNVSKGKIWSDVCRLGMNGIKSPERSARHRKMWADRPELKAIIGEKARIRLKDKRGYPERSEKLLNSWRKNRKLDGNPNWKGGYLDTKTDQVSLRHLTTYEEFAKSILSRDKARCVRCSAQEQLVVHHIVSVADAPDLFFDPDNVETLCRACHMKEHIERGDILPTRR